MLFRFHTGSIKSLTAQDNQKNVHGFDSILVRLKGQRNDPCVYPFSEFRFHTGSIKSVFGTDAV